MSLTLTISAIIINLIKDPQRIVSCWRGRSHKYDSTAYNSDLISLLNAMGSRWFEAGLTSQSK